MKKFELKFWHPVAGFALAKLLQRLNVNLIKLDFQPVLGDIITWIENLCVILILYVIARNIYRSVSEPTIHWEGYEYDKPYSKPSSPSKMQEIEKELDEIEATLDAISEAENSDGKITPIWNSKPPKR